MFGIHRKHNGKEAVEPERDLSINASPAVLRVMDSWEVADHEAQIDSEMAKIHHLKFCDVIEIIGTHKTVARCKLPSKDDKGSRGIRLNELTRWEAGVDIGQTVTVKKVERVSKAEKLNLAAKESIVPIDVRNVAFRLDGQCVTKYSNVSVSDLPERLFTEHFPSSLYFQVVGATPSADAYIITKDTVVQIAGWQASMSGQLRDGDSPVKDKTIVLGLDGMEVARALTDDNGSFSFSNVEARNHVIALLGSSPSTRTSYYILGKFEPRFYGENLLGTIDMSRKRPEEAHEPTQNEARIEIVLEADHKRWDPFTSKLLANEAKEAARVVEPSTGKELRVHETYTRDSGHGIARIDRNLMKQLGIVESDVVQIAGKRTTYARCMRLKRTDEAKGLIRIDSVTRDNAGVSLNDYVYVKKGSARAATEVAVVPLETIPTVDESFLPYFLEGRYFAKDDTFSVPLFGGRSTFSVFAYAPATPAITINQNTIIHYSYPLINVLGIIFNSKGPSKVAKILLRNGEEEIETMSYVDGSFSFSEVPLGDWKNGRYKIFVQDPTVGRSNQYLGPFVPRGTEKCTLRSDFL